MRNYLKFKISHFLRGPNLIIVCQTQGKRLRCKQDFSFDEANCIFPFLASAAYISVTS